MANQILQKTLLQIEGCTADTLAEVFEKRFIKVIDARLTKFQTAQNEDPFITRQDVADMYRITLPTVHAWIKAGILKPFKIGNKTRFLLSEVKAAATNVSRKKEVNNG